MMENQRAIILNLLNKMEHNAYSNIILNQWMQKTTLEKENANFIYHMVYGVIERKITLDMIIKRYAEKRKIASSVKNILRMGLYQIIYTHVKDYAAVNESVQLAKEISRQTAGFVNAILRRFIREGKVIDQSLESKYSAPYWLIQKLNIQYGKEKTALFLENSLDNAPLYIRVNTCKTDQQNLMDRLKKEKVITKPTTIPNALQIVQNDPIHTGAFQEGLFHIQDLSSQLCAITAAKSKPNTVLDLCGAPGGKTFTIAEETGAAITVCDLYPKRLDLIENEKKRLGLSNIVSLCLDAAKPQALNQFDVVLCDVPCSGIGVIRRKPEIKYKPVQTIQNLPKLQKQILAQAAHYLKPSGRLIYSTCSILKEENEEVIQNFLSYHQHFICKQKNTYFPEMFGGDGFFIAVLMMKNQKNQDEK